MYYGVELNTLPGSIIRERVHAFGSISALNDWIYSGVAIAGANGSRQSIPASDPLVRRAHREHTVERGE